VNSPAFYRAGAECNIVSSHIDSQRAAPGVIWHAALE
jgi:hypothetical protein